MNRRVRPHARHFQGSPAIWIPDNLKSGVTTASRYEPEINRTYADLARHYGAVVIPARIATPTDKPKVEVSVQIAQRWVVAALRHRTFFTLADLNAAIGERVDAINERPMTITGVSRRALFAQLDQPALLPVPRTRYELAEWKPCRVNIDYHVDVDHNLYSVPYQLVHERVEARFTAAVEVFCRGRRVASHGRLTGRGRFCYATGAHAARTSRACGVNAVPAHRVGGADRPGHRPARGRHPRAPPPSGTGLLRVPRPERLGRVHGPDRLEAACHRAEPLRSYRYRTIEHILLNHSMCQQDDDRPVRLHVPQLLSASPRPRPVSPRRTLFGRACLPDIRECCPSGLRARSIAEHR